MLARYLDAAGHAREVIARDGVQGSVLVIDCEEGTRADERLLAHLAADEPAENAALVCSAYVLDARSRSIRCRSVTPEDLVLLPECQGCLEPAALAGSPGPDPWPIDASGLSYRLELLPGRMSIPELRWCRRPPASQHGREPEAVSLREAVARLESYEPLRRLTLRALTDSDAAGATSTTVLRAELARVQESPIVLNRGLREAVLQATERQKLSMSEIATRCGRVKRDSRGNQSGETSWLGRRLGLLPEGGQTRPTPWVHSDVLALIARRGLGVSPREVEVP